MGARSIDCAASNQRKTAGPPSKLADSRRPKGHSIDLTLVCPLRRPPPNPTTEDTGPLFPRTPTAIHPTAYLACEAALLPPPVLLPSAAAATTVCGAAAAAARRHVAVDVGGRPAGSRNAWLPAAAQQASATRARPRTIVARYVLFRGGCGMGRVRRGMRIRAPESNHSISGRSGRMRKR